MYQQSIDKVHSVLEVKVEVEGRAPIALYHGVQSVFYEAKQIIQKELERDSRAFVFNCKSNFCTMVTEKNIADACHNDPETC